jgi:hypothetical protein
MKRVLLWLQEYAAEAGLPNNLYSLGGGNCGLGHHEGAARSSWYLTISIQSRSRAPLPLLNLIHS